MPNFAALKELGVIPEGMDCSKSNNPDATPEELAGAYGMTPEQVACQPPPTQESLAEQGYSVQNRDGQTGIGMPGGGPVFGVADTTSVGAVPEIPNGPLPNGPDGRPDPGSIPQPQGPRTPQQNFNEAAQHVGQIGSAAVGMMNDPIGGGIGMLGQIGAELGIPHAGELANLGKTLAASGMDMDKLGEMMSDPAALMGNLTNLAALAGIEIPPVMQQALQTAGDIASALKNAAPPPGVDGGAPGVYCEKQMIARVGTSFTAHGTPLAPGPGALTVLAMGTPVWRMLGDFHACPIVKGVIPDVGGVVLPQRPVTVFAMALPVAHHTDQVMEIPGGPNPILPMATAMARKKEEEEKKKKDEKPTSKEPPKDKVGDLEVKKMDNGDVKVGDNITIKPDPNDPDYQDKVVKDLKALDGTPTGHDLINDISKTGKQLTIEPTTSGNSCHFNGANGLVGADGKPGVGSDAVIQYNPDRTSIGADPWQNRPPAIGLGHEMVHADQAMKGEIKNGSSQNDSKPNPLDPTKMATAPNAELEAAGIPPHDTYPYNENKLRDEWKPKQPPRPFY